MSSLSQEKRVLEELILALISPFTLELKIIKL